MPPTDDVPARPDHDRIPGRPGLHGTPGDLEQFSLPALLRAARRSYGTAIRAALERTGYDDIPGNGLFVIGALANADAQLSDVIQWMGTSKQAAGQLVDTLVMRGYLVRDVDPGDRRRLIVSLTDRGGHAAEIIREAVEGVDHALIDRVGADRVRQTRITLASLITGDAPDA